MRDNQLKKKNFYPLTLIKDDRVIGHITLRHPTKDKKIVRLGFIIVDPEYRGKKFGKEMIIQAIGYAKNNLGVQGFNLGVFENNVSACKCYESVGFKESYVEKEAYTFHGEKWDCIEMGLNNTQEKVIIIENDIELISFINMQTKLGVIRMDVEKNKSDFDRLLEEEEKYILP